MTVYAPDSAAILYSPKNWAITSTSARTLNAGAYLRFMAVNTSTIALTFDTSALAGTWPLLRWRVDQGPWTNATVADRIALALPSPNNTWNTHLVEVVVVATSEQVNRWNNPSNAHVTLTGIDVGAGTLGAVAARPRRGIMLGDSITEGYKSLGPSPDVPGSDNTIAWSGRLADAVGAEVGVIGYGGIALAGGGVGNVPGLTSSYDKINADTPREFSGLDFIVVNIGENGGINQATMQAWLTELLGKIPPTCKVFVMRPFSGRGGAETSAAVTAVASAQVTFVDTTGWWDAADSSDGQHPYGYCSATITPKLAAIIQAALAGAPIVTNPVGFYRRDSTGRARPVATVTKAASA